jgi:cysteinyl-tRNA synthetase
VNNEQPEGNSEYDKRFFAAMDDDFNTTEALAVLFDLAHEINRVRTDNKDLAIRLGYNLRTLAGLLGILQRDPALFLQGEASQGLSNEEIEAKISQREAARAAKDWGESDRIRDELIEQGIILEDGAGITTWRRS